MSQVDPRPPGADPARTRTLSESDSKELLARFGSWTLTEPVEWTRSNRHTGIRRLSVAFEPA